MAFLSKEDGLWQLIEGVAHDEGMKVYDIERLSSPQKLRISVVPLENSRREVTKQVGKKETTTKIIRSAVNSDDCSRLCKRLSVIFLAEGEKFGLDEDTELEISSPGINRNLRLSEHFADALGEKVKVVSKLEKPAVLVGTVCKWENNILAVSCDNALTGNAAELTEIALTNIKRATIEFDYSF